MWIYFRHHYWFQDPEKNKKQPWFNRKVWWFFFPSHNCVSFAFQIFFLQPWSSEFPILQQNLCFVAAVCSHYVLFSLNCDCAHLFTAPCAHPAVQGPKYCCLGASTASPRVAQKGWVWNFSHALLCSCWVPAFFLHSKKKGVPPNPGRTHSRQSSSAGCFFDTSAARQSTRFCFPK